MPMDFTIETVNKKENEIFVPFSVVLLENYVFIFRQATEFMKL